MFFFYTFHILYKTHTLTGFCFSHTLLILFDWRLHRVTMAVVFFCCFVCLFFYKWQHVFFITATAWKKLKCKKQSAFLEPLLHTHTHTRVQVIKEWDVRVRLLSRHLVSSGAEKINFFRLFNKRQQLIIFFLLWLEPKGLRRRRQRKSCLFITAVGVRLVDRFEHRILSVVEQGLWKCP